VSAWSWLERPGAPVRVGVIFLVAVTVIAAIAGLPHAFRERSDTATRNAALSFSDREIAGGNGLIVDQQAAYEARARIPVHASYRVAVDPRYRGGSDLTVPYVASWFQYFLMPRRPAPDAPWIVCYGCDVSQYGPRAQIVWRGPSHISLVKVGQ